MYNSLEELAEPFLVDSLRVALFEDSNIVGSKDLSNALGEGFPGVVTPLAGSGGSAGHGAGNGCLQIKLDCSLEGLLWNMY